MVRRGWGTPVELVQADGTRYVIAREAKASPG